MKKQIIAGAVLAVLATTGAYTYASNTSSGSVTKTEIMDLVKKVRDGVNLTTEEQAKLNAVKLKKHYKTGSGETMGEGNFGPREGKMGMMGEGKDFGPMTQLTDAEKTALESMSDTEKKAFFDKKILEAKAKQELREIVIDKLLAGTSLSSDEETIRAEIIKERAEMKAKKAEIEEIKTILDKKRYVKTLTSDEQTKLIEFEANKQQVGEYFKGKKIRHKTDNK